MAKRKITYDDGTSVIEDVPESQATSAAIGYQKQLADSFKKSDIPKTGDPTVGGQDQTQAFRQAGPEGRWEQLKNQSYPLGSAVQLVGGVGALAGHGNSPDKRASGLSDIVRGGGALAAPFVLPGAMAAAPLTTGAGIVGGMGSQGLAQSLLEPNRSLGPGTKSLMSDIAGLAGGGLASGATKLGAAGVLKLTKGPLGIMALLNDLVRSKAPTAPVGPAVRPTIASVPKPPVDPIAEAVLKAQAKHAYDTTLSKLQAPVPDKIPITSTTNQFRPAPSGTPTGPYIPSQPPAVGTNMGQDVAQMMQAAQRARNTAQLGTLEQGPRNFQTPLASPEQQAAAQRQLFGGNKAVAPKPLPNQKPISSEEQVAAMLQSLKNAAPDLNARASSKGVPSAALPPALQPHTPVAPPTSQEILASVLQHLLTQGKQQR